MSLKENQSFINIFYVRTQKYSIIHYKLLYLMRTCSLTMKHSNMNYLAYLNMFRDILIRNM